MKKTRRFVLTTSLLLMLAGIFVIAQGVQVLTPIVETFGLASRVQTDRLLISPTLLAVPASNYTFLTADLNSGAQVKGSLQVVDSREIGFYVMDEGNFTLWRAGRPSAVILAKPAAISYNLTFRPQATGPYYFVFDNQDNNRRTVIFSLSAVEEVVVLNPLLNYAGYELVALGLVLMIFSIKLRGKKREPVLQSGKALPCRFCGAELEREQAFCRKCGRAQK